MPYVCGSIRNTGQSFLVRSAIWTEGTSMCSWQQEGCYTPWRIKCHSLPHVMLPLQTGGLDIIHLLGTSPIEDNIFFTMVAFSSMKSATTLVLELISALQIQELGYSCLSTFRGPRVTACHMPSCTLLFLTRKHQPGAAPTFTIRLRCSSDWLKFVPISKILIAPSSQRFIQVWYSSRSGSLSQNVLKTSQTVSWHTEGTRKVWC